MALDQLLQIHYCLYRHGWPEIDSNSTQQRLMSCGSGHLVACSSAPLILYNCTVPPFSIHSERVHDLGVVVDSGLTLADHVSHIRSVCFFYIRQLRLIPRSLTVDAAHSLVRGLIHSRLDYCNGLLTDLPASQLA